MNKTYINVAEITGLTPLSVASSYNSIIFEFEHNIVKLYHEQDCCESFWIESIVGDLEDLVGNPLLMAEESSGDYQEDIESGTWTFYKFATIKGYVDIRFIGESNGYYSEVVDVVKYEKIKN